MDGGDNLGCHPQLASLIKHTGIYTPLSCIQGYVAFTTFFWQDNTFQAILISDGTYTYVIFVYFCGLLEWGSPTIGYNAAGGSFSNFETSSVQVACLNQPLSDWSNVVYRLSTASAEIPLPGIIHTPNFHYYIYSYLLPLYF